MKEILKKIKTLKDPIYEEQQIIAKGPAPQAKDVIAKATFESGQHVTIIKDCRDMFGRTIPAGSEGIVNKVYSSNLEITFKVDGKDINVMVSKSNIVK